MKPFTIVLIAAFLVFAAIGVTVLATFSGRNETAIGTVEIWGPLPEAVVDAQIEALRLGRRDFDGVTYREFPGATFMDTLIEAIAASRGPDLVIFPAAYLAKDGEKLFEIPYTTMSRRDFQDTFIEAGEIFLGENGFTGFPYLVDPLVLYWNRTLFAGAAIATPPRYWDEVAGLAPRLTHADQNGTLTQSAIAFGLWDNVASAKRIILSIMRELGNPAVVLVGGKLESVFRDSAPSSISAAESTLRFYTEFADPTKPTYSWNRSQPNSRNAFLGGRVAMYVGPASELFGIQAANPNLNFDMTAFPAARGAGNGSVAELYGLSVPRGAKNPRGAVVAAMALTSATGQSILTVGAHVPSVRRDLLTVSPADPFSATLREATLSAYAFLDPDPLATESILRRAVEDVASGRQSVSEAVTSADDEISALFKK